MNAIFAFVLPLLPVVVAGALFVPRTGAAALAAAPWVPASALGLLALHGEVVEFPWLLLGARIGIDATAAPLLLLAIVAWTLAGWHAVTHLPGNGRRRFFCWWLLTWTGNLGVLITLDGASFYAAYAMMTFAAYGLVVHYRRPEDLRAGRVYLVMAVIAEGLLLGALLILGAGFGNPALEEAGGQVALLPGIGAEAVAVLFAVAFAVKMGLVPLHLWLPLAHPQAPVPASAVLSGVILKAGLLGWLRFLPFEAEEPPIAGLLLLGAGLLTAFYGVAAGLGQRRAKSVLAYSSVSQMGLVAAAVGLALLHPDHAPLLISVAVLYALHHGLAKAALFLSVDVARSAPGLARVLMWWPALALAGAPLTSGALAKALLKGAVPKAEAGWLEPVLLASSVATATLLARFLVLAWPRTGAEATEGSTAPWAMLLAAMALLPWAVVFGQDPTWAARPFRGDYLRDAAWPVLAGGALALGAWWWLRGSRIPAVPEGDLIALLPRIGAVVRPPAPARVTLPVRAATAWLCRVEDGFARLALALVFWLFLLGALFLAT
jgi:formate hydrogenlyase subunit 3/multisubunit Na+/H+ antiporter MnhD subunit